MSEERVRPKRYRDVAGEGPGASELTSLADGIDLGIDALAEILRRVRESAAPDGVEISEDLTPAVKEALSVSGQVYGAWVRSGIRYWSGLANAHGEYCAKLAESLSRSAGGDVAEASRRMVVDETSAYLREVADLSMREARVFQAEVEKAQEKVRGLVGDGDSGEPPRRYAKAKP
jgi:hypothetical protein